MSTAKLWVIADNNYRNVLPIMHTIKEM